MDLDEILQYLCESLNVDEEDGPTIRLEKSLYEDAYRTMECAKFLRKLIGVLEEVEVRDAGIRVRVQIDVNVPLCRGLRVSLEEVMKEVSLIL
ncbi:hypothetical protein PanWU01x14_325280 [Parasponia andersonii]|uniref:Uncharacterized protein n=1 Tax=Parasponia andersonii TaxID=3476 RepID=A0A2P5AJW5_PARAD|nr:hypothetical protein PanWU01x14_325280 [Parasponia andersonii]